MNNVIIKFHDATEEQIKVNEEEFSKLIKAMEDIEHRGSTYYTVNGAMVTDDSDKHNDASITFNRLNVKTIVKTV